MIGRGWHYDQLHDRVVVHRDAPSYFEHNAERGRRPGLPDVVPADFEPQSFEIRAGFVIQVTELAEATK